MIVAFQLLKKIFPELNKKVIGKERIIEVFSRRNIQYLEVPMEGLGAYFHISSDKTDYVFIKYNIQGLLYHETLAYEGVHAFCHIPAPFLLSKNNLEAEVLSLVMLMPETDLPRLNRIKHQLEPDSYEMVIKRNQIKAMWKI